MRRVMFSSLVLCTVACLAVMPSTLSAGDAADKSSGNDSELTEEQLRQGFSTVSLAAELALQGEKLQSPHLLLAAADVLERLKESARPVEGVETETTGSQPGSQSEEEELDKEMPELEPDALRQRALEMAQSDKEKELIQKWIDMPRTRGLAVEQGRGLESIFIKGVEFKVLFAGVIDNGYHRTLSNVRFEGKRPAIVAVVGDGDGDLDLWVYDGNSGNLIGKDTDSTSICTVSWTPRYLGPFTIRVSNVGSISERCVILANW